MVNLSYIFAVPVL